VGTVAHGASVAIRQAHWYLSPQISDSSLRERGNRGNAPRRVTARVLARALGNSAGRSMHIVVFCTARLAPTKVARICRHIKRSRSQTGHQRVHICSESSTHCEHARSCTTQQSRMMRYLLGGWGPAKGGTRLMMTPLIPLRESSNVDNMISHGAA